MGPHSPDEPEDIAVFHGNWSWSRLATAPVPEVGGAPDIESPARVFGESSLIRRASSRPSAPLAIHSSPVSGLGRFTEGGASLEGHEEGGGWRSAGRDAQLDLR